MDEVNKSGPYYEAVSLCYFNGNDSGWSWTRVADIENGELTTLLFTAVFSTVALALATSELSIVSFAI